MRKYLILTTAIILSAGLSGPAFAQSAELTASGGSFEGYNDSSTSYGDGNNAINYDGTVADVGMIPDSGNGFDTLSENVAGAYSDGGSNITDRELMILLDTLDTMSVQEQNEALGQLQRSNPELFNLIRSTDRSSLNPGPENRPGPLNVSGGGGSGSDSSAINNANQNNTLLLELTRESGSGGSSGEGSDRAAALAALGVTLGSVVCRSPCAIPTGLLGNTSLNNPAYYLNTWAQAPWDTPYDTGQNQAAAGSSQFDATSWISQMPNGEGYSTTLGFPNPYSGGHGPLVSDSYAQNVDINFDPTGRAGLPTAGAPVVASLFDGLRGDNPVAQACFLLRLLLPNKTPILNSGSTALFSRAPPRLCGRTSKS